MLNKYFALSLICILFLSNAAQANWTYSVPGQVNPEEPALVALFCARSIVEKKLGGISGFRKALSIIKSLQNNASNAVALEGLAIDCDRTMRKLSPGDVSENFQQHELEIATINNHQVRELISDFINPNTSCDKIGIAATVALGLGTQVKVDAAHCRADNGREWLQLSTGGGFGKYSSPALSVNKGSYTEENNGTMALKS